MDSFGRNELHYVIVDKPSTVHESEILKLIETGIDVNTQDKRGWSALHFAAQENSLPAVAALIRSGANVELKDSFGNTPLFRAVFCSRGNGEIIKALLVAGANPDSENNHGVSPRSLASTIGNYDVAQFFE